MVRHSSVNNKKHRKIGTVVAITVAIALSIFGIMLASSARTVPTSAGAIAPKAKTAPMPHGSSEILIDARTRRVLAGTNIDARLEMASTTKVVTALVVIENNDLNRVVTVPKEAVGIEGSSVYLRAGDKYTVRELLYGLMLRSGNDCAVALAINTAGSVEAFAELTNKKVASMGLINSHFVNPHGLHAEGHYTSAYDLAMLTAEAYKYEEFEKIVSAKTFRVGTGEHTQIWKNKNKLLWNFDGANGVKTGFTKKAGRCLVAGANRNGMQLISVVLNVGPMFERCAELMRHGFTSYNAVTVARKGEACYSAELTKSTVPYADLYTKRDIVIPTKSGELVTTDIIFTRKMAGSIAKDECVGEIRVYIDNRLQFSEKLFTLNACE